MLVDIKVHKNRYIEASRRYLGTTGEHNATILNFEFFKELNGESVSAFQKRLVAILPEGTLKYEIDSTFSLPVELTQMTELILIVELIKDDRILFKSYPHTFTFIDSGDNPEVNIIQTAIDSAKDDFCEALAKSLETATGESQEGKKWEELNAVVMDFALIENLIDESGVIEYDDTFKD